MKKQGIYTWIFFLDKIKKKCENIFLLNYKYNTYLPEYCINLNFDINKDNITKTQYNKLKNIIEECLNKLTI